MKNLALFLFLFSVFMSVGCLQKKSSQVGDESDHGIVFPKSAKNFQNLGDSTSWLPDRGIATVFELEGEELEEFLKQLQIEDRREPIKKAGDPLVNGWNVWPQNAKSAVPGNEQYSGFKKTWKGEAIPQEMLSCGSATGDWLHVEVWKLPGETNLLKLYTDWN